MSTRPSRDEREAELRREFPPRRLKGPCDGLPVLAQPGNGGPGPENAGAVWRRRRGRLGSARQA